MALTERSRMPSPTAGARRKQACPVIVGLASEVKHGEDQIRQNAKSQRIGSLSGGDGEELPGTLCATLTRRASEGSSLVFFRIPRSRVGLVWVESRLHDPVRRTPEASNMPAQGQRPVATRATGIRRAL